MPMLFEPFSIGRRQDAPSTIPGYRRPPALLAISALLLGMVSAGCGPGRPETVPVEGIVTFNGKPVADAAVQFIPVDGGRPAQGATDSQGRFKLSTFEDGDGALPGAHSVTVQKVRVSGVVEGREGLDSGIAEPKIEYLLPERYSQTSTSGLTVEVASGAPPVNLALTSK